jgi:hypothetical protein
MGEDEKLKKKQEKKMRTEKKEKAKVAAVMAMAATTGKTPEEGASKIPEDLSHIKGLLPTEVLLDNQANISIVNPKILKNTREAKHKIKVMGVGDNQLIVNYMGDLGIVFEVYASEHMKAYVLSFADLEDICEITYSKGDAFVVLHMEDRTVEFKHRNKL